MKIKRFFSPPTPTLSSYPSIGQSSFYRYSKKIKVFEHIVPLSPQMKTPNIDAPSLIYLIW